MFRFSALLLFAIVSVVPALAQNAITTSVPNQYNANKLCNKNFRVDATGCALLSKPDWSPFSAIRTLAAHLWDAQKVARQSEDRSEATSLFNQLQDAIGSQQQVKRLGGIGPDNAGVLIERALISKLQDCKSGQPCEVLSTDGKKLFIRIASFLGRIYPEKVRHWALVKQAVDPIR